MKRSDFHYTLPPELIATHPAPQREASRLMRIQRNRPGWWEHHHFTDLPGLLRPGDCLVLNDSRVIPARLYARRPGGGQSELLLIAPLDPATWEVMTRPARKLRPGMRLTLPGGATADVLEGGGDRTRRVRFHVGGDLLAYLQTHGTMPLPPYILQQRKERGEPLDAAPEDRQRYQTVYAADPGSIAAPTAGLHFTEPLLAALAAREVEVRRVTLHVGLGTFEPVDVDDLSEHRMHEERYAIDEADALAIDAARRDPGRRVVAVGTTTLRTLEANLARHGAIVPAVESTDLFITPGYPLGAVDALVTNYHLPESTLLMLVSALAGRETILSAYAEAIAERYRFFSFGDAMLIDTP